MYHNIFDSHAHYDDEQFDIDRDELLGSFKEKGISGIVCCGVNIETSEFAVELSHKYDFVYSAVGFHPLDNDEYNDGDLERIKELAKRSEDRNIFTFFIILLSYFSSFFSMF